MKMVRPDQGRSEDFIRERARARFIFNLTALAYPLIERHLFPRYRQALEALDLPRDLTVLDVATGSGILAAAFAQRGHPATGLDFSDRLLRRARRRFRNIEIRTFDLVGLPEIASRSYGIVSCGYLLHGLSPAFREAILKNMARIAGCWVVVFDYCCAGGWFVRLIEGIEGPNYPQFIAGDRREEFAAAGLHVVKSFRTSSFGDVWLCRPERK